MPERNDIVVVGHDGTLTPLGADTGRRLGELSGRFRILVDTKDLLFLKREQDEFGLEMGSGPRVLMAGEIISRMTMLEIINVIATCGWVGELHVYAPNDVHRTLMFDRGAVKYAESNHPDDRLGEVMYRLGAIRREQLDELLFDMRGDKRFGQMCLERGVLDQEHLFQYLQKQVEHIFYGALLVADGVYMFANPDESASPPIASVHISVQGLLMEGVQRIDEMTLFRERIPNGSMCPKPIANAPDRKLEETAVSVLRFADGARSIHDIAREVGLGEFETTKAIYQLLQQGQVSLHAGSRIDQEAARGLLNQFNDVMRDIFMAVATYGGVDQTRATLSAWIQGSGYGPFFGDEVEEDGSLDIDYVVRALSAVKSDSPIEALHQALHELAAFALFTATTTLPRDQELTLSRDVNRRLKSIRM